MRHSGERTQRVIIQTPTAATDALLGRSESWGTLATVWAEVKPTSVDERMDGQQVGAYTRWDVTTDYRTDVTPKMRISWAGRTLYILGSEPSGQNMRETMLFRCEERV
jgi:SPP1 family predicted phage head-tail adaptor